MRSSALRHPLASVVSVLELARHGGHGACRFGCGGRPRSRTLSVTLRQGQSPERARNGDGGNGTRGLRPQGRRLQSPATSGP